MLWRHIGWWRTTATRCLQGRCSQDTPHGTSLSRSPLRTTHRFFFSPFKGQKIHHKKRAGFGWDFIKGLHFWIFLLPLWYNFESFSKFTTMFPRSAFGTAARRGVLREAINDLVEWCRTAATRHLVRPRVGRRWAAWQRVCGVFFPRQVVQFLWNKSQNVPNNSYWPNVFWLLFLFNIFWAKKSIKQFVSSLFISAVNLIVTVQDAAHGARKSKLHLCGGDQRHLPTHGQRRYQGGRVSLGSTVSLLLDFGRC